MLKVVVDATPISPRSRVDLRYKLNCSLNKLQAQEDFELGNFINQDWKLGSTFTPLSILTTLTFIYHSYQSEFQTCWWKHPLSQLCFILKILWFSDIVHGTNYSVYPCQNAKELWVFMIFYKKYPKYITHSVAKQQHRTSKRCFNGQT